MLEEIRWRRPGRVAGWAVVRGTAVVVAAWVSRGRERFGVAVVVSSTTVVVWACGRRGRRGVVVAPYILADGVVHRRGLVEVIDITAVLAFWREAGS